MITKLLTRAEVEGVLADGGNFTKVGLPVFAENFFEYGYQNISKRLYREEMEELLTNLEMNARENGDELCGAVMGKAVLLTFKRRQVVVDAISYLSRAAMKGVPGAVTELCAWYAERIITNDLSDFPNTDVGVDDCYDPTPEFPRQTFPRNIAECRHRLVDWLSKTPEEEFDDVKSSFAALDGSSLDIPQTWADAAARLSEYLDENVARAKLQRAKELIEGATGDGASKEIADGAKIVRDLAERIDSLDAWKYMLECHEKKVAPFKSNKVRRMASAAIVRLSGDA